MHIGDLLPGRRPTLGAEYDWRPPNPPSGLARALLCGALAMSCVAGPARTVAAGNRAPIAAAIADFDNFDTSGEDADRTAAHAGRVNAFAGLLRSDLAAQNGFEIVELACPKAPCSAARMPSSDLLQAARQAGARLLIYGGIHKESTLVQWGKIDVVDLDNDKLVLNQTFSFRGDTDQAFRRAAAFIVPYVKALTPAAR